MSSPAQRRAERLGAPLLLLLLACGPAVKITPNEYSQAKPPEAIQADLDHCDEIADEVQAEYGPHVEIGDSVFDAAAENFAIHNRYKAACLRAKGYVVGGHDPVELPASAVEKARGPRAAPSTPEAAR